MLYFVWERRRPATVYVTSDEADVGSDVNSAPVDEFNGYGIFTWNDEEGYLLHVGSSVKDVISKLMIENNGELDLDWDLSAWTDYIRKSKVDGDSSYGYAVVNLAKLIDGSQFKQGDIQQ